MKYISDENDLHERGKRITALLPGLRGPHKARSKALMMDYAKRLNEELEKAMTAPEAPSIFTMGGYEEMRHQQMIEAERKRY